MANNHPLSIYICVDAIPLLLINNTIYRRFFVGHIHMSCFGATGIHVLDY